MRLSIVGIIAACGIAATADAATATREVEVAANLEAVDYIPALRRMHSWSAIDRDSLVVWATPFDPYLIELSYPSFDLPFAQTIGVTEFAGRVHSRFDSVYVGGLRYRIDGIFRLGPEDAKALLGRDR